MECVVAHIELAADARIEDQGHAISRGQVRHKCLEHFQTDEAPFSARFVQVAKIIAIYHQVADFVFQQANGVAQAALAFFLFPFQFALVELPILQHPIRTALPDTKAVFTFVMGHPFIE
ncbi:hypothetical protein D3C80_1250010 [compost metagenome]